MFLYTPEAGLHRDGEQARIVDVVRRRQQALQQLIYHEQGTFEWNLNYAYEYITRLELTF